MTEKPKTKGTTPDEAVEETEASRNLPTPSRKKSAAHLIGDADTIVRIDSPDDVDLYRHDGPPPGFKRTRTVGRPNVLEKEHKEKRDGGFGD